MTIGSDQLDAWGRTLIEADELYRELQLLIRINPEAYTVDSTALAANSATGTRVARPVSSTRLRPRSLSVRTWTVCSTPP